MTSLLLSPPSWGWRRCRLHSKLTSPGNPHPLPLRSSPEARTSTSPTTHHPGSAGEGIKLLPSPCPTPLFQLSKQKCPRSPTTAKRKLSPGLLKRVAPHQDHQTPSSHPRGHWALEGPPGLCPLAAPTPPAQLKKPHTLPTPVTPAFPSTLPTGANSSLESRCQPPGQAGEVSRGQRPSGGVITGHPAKQEGRPFSYPRGAEAAALPLKPARPGRAKWRGGSRWPETCLSQAGHGGLWSQQL